MARREEDADRQKSARGCQGDKKVNTMIVCPLLQEAKERTQLQKQGALMWVSLRPSC